LTNSNLLEVCHYFIIQQASANAPVELLVQSWENLTGVPTQQEYEPAHTEENPPKSRQKQLVDRGKKPRKDSTIGIGKKWRQSLVTNSPGELRGQRQGKKRKNDNQGEGSNQQGKKYMPIRIEYFFQDYYYNDQY
jgi:hypothetical protein